MSRSRRQRNCPPPDILPLASLLDSIGEAVQIMDAAWNFCYVNRAAADFGGKVAMEMQGKNIWAEFPELVGSSLEDACHRAMRDQVRINFEFRYPTRDQWFEIRLHPSPRYLTLYAAEITRRVQAEARADDQDEIEALNARLQDTVQESRAMNEALTLSGVRQHELTEIAGLLNARLQRAMQESHHRIKNNLQVISALVEMQMDEGGAAADDERLKRIHQHIRALAALHDLLTQQAKDTAETSVLSTRAFLGRLLPMLQEMSGGRRIEAEIEDVMLAPTKAASLALLVSECFNNAIKHAVGEVEVILRAEGDKARLEVRDHGGGFPPDFDPRKAAHTGLSLIDATARYDLRGEVHYGNRAGGGGCVVVTFPIPNVESGRNTQQEIQRGDTPSPIA